MRLLVVEDEAQLAESLKRGLELQGFAVDWLAEPEKARTRILLYHKEYDLIILDLMLPGLSGEDLVRTARSEGITTPIIILTGKNEVDSKVEVLNMGADDYVVKPFSFDELLARINSVLRRPHEVKPVILAVGDIEMDTSIRSVKKGGKEISLTLKEYALLECFMRRPNEALSREDIFNQVWDFNSVSWSNVLDVHMKNLRKKLEGGTTHFETIRGVGYRLVAN